MEKNDDIKSNQYLDLLNFAHLSKIVILILYFIVLGFTVVFGVFIATYFLFVVLFLFVASSLGGYKIIDKFLSLPTRQKILLIFIIALLLRWIMLFQTQVITHDIETYVRRSKLMLDGNIPYRDFYGGNKPPLYEFMLYFMGLIVTPGVIQFRAVFSVFDALIPIVLFFLCTLKYNDRFAIVASLSYALFPVSIITIGLSGHYDSVVALFSLISILLLFKNKLNFSGLSLGLAFALKIYPVVLLPFFISTIKTWEKRILYVVLFLVPTLVADGVLYLISPSAFFEYIREESTWEGATAFSSNIEMMLNTSEILSIKISWIVLGFFAILILWLFIDWLSPKREKNLIKWFKIIILIFVIYYGIYLVYGILYYKNPLYIAIIPLIIYFPIAALLLYKYLPKIVPASLMDVDSEGIFIVSTFSIMLFLFGLPNYAPWYFIWFFPFMLAIKTDKIRYSLLWILPWHGIGKAMRVIPGTPTVN